jgi:UDP-N-acetylglucosamine--N-acetylmuramyl-(pentapeptide) pyrophosphoryl-undecaprenol N-acetylglucosamine transferase
MKFALAGGGTGGHAYPAIAVAERLRESFDTDLVFYGTEHGPERALAEDAGILFRSIPASQVRGRSPWRLTSGVFNLMRGEIRARHDLKRERPDAVFATGGYASAPIGQGAHAARVPMLLFLPDVKPGWAVRYMQRHATTVACSVDASLAYLPARKTVVTGYPVRRQFAEATREDGAKHFGLDPLVRTVLVTGGSQGAHHINRAISAALPRLLDRAQVLHICGRDEVSWLNREREELPQWQRDRYLLVSYTKEMALAMAAADLAVTRAGASTLGELPAANLPAVIVPLQLSDQAVNARYLADQGAATIVNSDDVGQLVDTVLAILESDEQLSSMRTAMTALNQPDAAGRLAALLREMGQRQGVA